MSTIKRILAAFALFLVVLLSFFLVQAVVQRRRVENNVGGIHQGMPEQEVVAILGKPASVARPCWGRKDPCSFDYVYPMPFRFGPADWVISFDESKHVIAKEDWYSP